VILAFLDILKSRARFTNYFKAFSKGFSTMRSNEWIAYGKGRVQFVNSNSPGNTLLAEQKRQTHSHAARTAHAKQRHLCTQEYQLGRASQIVERAQAVKEQRVALRGSVQRTLDAVETEQPVLPSPRSLLASDRRDPFQSFARSFEPVEHFLLDHCKSLHHFH